MKSQEIELFVVFLLNLGPALIQGHGRMVHPPGRSSLWRYMKGVPYNYNDNGLYCGGFKRQWIRNKGKCGVCGDPYDTPHPQPNENTGVFGKGIIRAGYQPGAEIRVKIELTANHLGHFAYSLCQLKNSTKRETGEGCFKPLRLANGRTSFQVAANQRYFINKVQLPKGFVCKHCVLRWEYTAGNNWGYCPDGKGRKGCGPQETFRSCADITISHRFHPYYH